MDSKGMTAAEVDALERVIVRVHASLAQLSLLGVKPANIDAAIEKVRNVAVNGLTRKDAEAVVRAVDTEGEREQVRKYMGAFASKTDSDLLTLAVIRMARQALADEQPAPHTTAATPPGVNDPVLYLPITCGWYDDRAKLPATLAWIADQAARHGIAGRLGVCIETSGATGNLGVKTADWSRWYATLAGEVVGVIDKCKSLGIPVKIDLHNSNDPGKGWAVSWGKPHGADKLLALASEHAAAIKQHGGWVIAQGCSENDSATPNRSALRKALAAHLQSEYRAEPGRDAGAHYDEIHIGKPFSGKPASRTLYSTDKGEGITSHFEGGVWTAHKPRVSACIQSATAILANGGKFALYHRAPALHILDHAGAYAQIISAVAPYLRPVAAPDAPKPTTGARIVKIKDAGGEHISVTVEGWQGWPKKKWDNGKTTYGRLMIATPSQPKGVYVDALTENQMNGSRKTLSNAFKTDSHSLNVRKSDPIKVWVESYDGRKSNQVDWVWPYRST